MKFNLILPFVLLLFSFLTVEAQTTMLAHKDDASRLCDDVLIQLEQSEILSAIKLLRGKTTQDEKVLTDLIAFLELSASKYGQVTGSSLAKTQGIGENIFRFTYALQYDKHPVWLQFYFYKVKGNFELKKIDWGEDMAVLF